MSKLLDAVEAIEQYMNGLRSAECNDRTIRQHLAVIRAEAKQFDDGSAGANPTGAHPSARPGPDAEASGETVSAVASPGASTDPIARAKALLEEPSACDTGACTHDYPAHCEQERQWVDVRRDDLRALIAEAERLREENKGHEICARINLKIGKDLTEDLAKALDRLAALEAENAELRRNQVRRCNNYPSCTCDAYEVCR